MIGTQRIQGADLFANNNSGGSFVPALQVSTGRRSKLHKTIVSNIGATDLYLWIFDTASGAAAGTGPRMVVYCPSGVCTTLDLSDGIVFTAGIYLSLSTAQPVNPASTVTAASNNAAIMDCSYSLQ